MLTVNPWILTLGLKSLFVGALLLMLGCEPNGHQAEIDIQDSTHATADQQVEATVRKYIDASIVRDFSTQYQLLSEKDRAVKSEADYIAEKVPKKHTFADTFYEKISYTIADIQLNDDQARVDVLYHFPDVELMIKQMFGLSILSDFTDEEFVSMKSKLEQEYQDKSIPMRRSKRSYTVKREGDGWRIYLGWDMKAAKK